MLYRNPLRERERDIRKWNENSKILVCRAIRIVVSELIKGERSE